MKYLEALRRHLEQLHLESNPVAAVNTVLPTLIAAMRQMDSISRFYARNGYLGLLCMKVCTMISINPAKGGERRMNLTKSNCSQTIVEQRP